jgi:hypothetical protein
LTWSTCLVYLDDIVIYTKGGIERHLVELPRQSWRGSRRRGLR